MARKSLPNIYGGKNYYDENGKKIGYSLPNVWGGYNYYDSSGKKKGDSLPNGWGGHKYYQDGKKIGNSLPNVYGGQNYYQDGKKVGHSEQRLLGEVYKKEGEGCYIATCVYGSYDTEQVQILRRFRDDCLANRQGGRLFIRLYYFFSPKLVRRFGGNKQIRLCWKKVLDPVVECLRRRQQFSPEQNR